MTNIKDFFLGSLKIKKLKIFIVVYSFFLTALISMGIMTKAHIGTITWGPTTDFWAMSIAISKIKYNLDGGMGYKEVSNQLAKYLTTTNRDISVNDEGTQKLVAVPQNITVALRAASLIPKDKLGEPTITTYAEDIGFAEFYEMAFRLFGIHAFSTHYFYFSFLFFSMLIFLFTYHRYPTGLVLFSLASCGFFLLANSSDFFSPSVPTFSANRFLSTLAIYPFFHLITFLTIPYRPTKKEMGALIIQSLALVFALRFRTSANWVIIAFLTILGFMYLLQYFLKRAKKNIPTEFQQNRIMRAIVVFFMILVTTSIIQNAFLNPIYFSDRAMPHHFRWHSAFLGLTFHPQWSTNVPYPELADRGGDGVAFGIYELYMKKWPNKYKLNSINGMQLYEARTHEKIIKKEFFKFIQSHVLFTAQLYLIYKPLKLFKVIKTFLLSISQAAWLVTLPLVLALLLVIFNYFTKKEGLTVFCFLALSWGASLLPNFWAYPAPHVMSDTFLMTLILFIALSTILISILLKYIKLRF